MPHRRLVGICLCLAALGCGSEIPGGQIFLIRGVVVGTVTQTGGGPVAAATVIANARYSPSVLLTDSVQTDNAGHYVLTLRVANLPDATAALDLTFRAPPASGLANRDTTGLQLVMTSVNPPPDTTVVNLVLLP